MSDTVDVPKPEKTQFDPVNIRTTDIERVKNGFKVRFSDTNYLCETYVFHDVSELIDKVKSVYGS